jgi:hypothetical protein
MDLHAALSDPRRYRRQIDRLHRRHTSTSALYSMRQEGVSLATLCLNRGRVARLLAASVARSEYRLGPARLRRIQVEGKSREVFAYPLTDMLVHGVVAEWIEETMQPRLSPSLYSYRKGVSWWRPVSALAAFLREHRRSRPEPRTRGLYVLRRDVEAYTDSIPVSDGSPLWAMLETLLPPGAPISSADWDLVRSVVRPLIALPGGGRLLRDRGVPTGQPISCVLFNLYLADFDRRFDGIPGAFYGRYCDDLIFAHPDPAIVRAADARIDALLAEMELSVNRRKSRTLYVTGAGRASLDWEEARGATSIPFLGCAISARGTIALGRVKRRRLLAELDRRLRRTARALKGSDLDESGRILCAVANQALEARTEFSQARSAALLRRAVTDRRDLKELDYWIARRVVRALTGQAGARGFREVPYRRLRLDWGLISLRSARDAWRRRKSR